MRYIILTLASFCTLLSFGQNIPNSRKVDWSIAGYEGEIPCITTERNAVTEFGIDNTGASDVSSQVNNALTTISEGEVLYFPAGNYLFKNGINVPPKRVIRGASPSATTFNFDFSNNQTCISIKGNGPTGLETAITAVSNFRESTLTVASTNGLSVGDEVEIQQANDPAIHGAEDMGDLTSWAENLKGQLAQIKAINGNVITLDRSLTFQYDINFAMSLKKVSLTEEVGLESFKLVRISDNGTGADNNNFWISYAKNTWMRQIHSEYSSRYHLRIDFSRNIEVSESYLDKAYNCGGGGAGYGLLVQDHVTECLFENNIAKALRHPWIAKEGAARNVFAYNFSVNSTQGTNCDANPLTDSYADLSLHGHYPAYNLFEGNIVYRVTSSDSWGPNGPGNTIFRNRVLGAKGIWIQSYSKEQNIIANELTYPNAQFEMDRDNTANGSTLNYSNYGTSGLIDTEAPNTVENSYYLDGKPAFFGNLAWPAIGPGVSFNTGKIPAQVRYEASTYFEDGPTCAACGVPDLGPNQSLCGINSINLDSKLATNNRSFEWYQDGNLLPQSGASITVSEAGIYKLVADSAGCITEDTKEITSVLPNIYLGSDVTLCSPAFIELTSPLINNNYSYSWTKDNTEISNEANISITRAGTYKLEVTANGCAPVQDQIIVSSNLIKVKDDTLCAAGTATLKALDGGSYVWYDQPENGNVLGSGATLELDIIDAKTVYVEETGGTSVSVGMLAPTLTDNKAYDDDRFDRKISFDVLATLKLDSLSVWSSSANQVVIRILAADNTTEIYTITHNNITTGENRLKVGAELDPGSYLLDFEGTNGELYYSNENDLSIQFPYTSAGLIAITGGNPTWITDKPYYMYAYNWKVTTGNPCDRTPVFAVVDPGTCVLAGNSFEENSGLNIYPNPSANGIFQLSETSAYQVYSTTGKRVLTGESSKIDLSSFPKGLYLIKTEKETKTVIYQ